MKVENMTNSRGNKVANQFIIHDQNREVFQSYGTIIAEKITPCDQSKPIEIHLDRNKWDYSKATGTYRNIFLGESKKETERKIKSGEYTLANLNP